MPGLMAKLPLQFNLGWCGHSAASPGQAAAASCDSESLPLHTPG